MEDWQGYAAQKNSAIAKACGEWILSLDADESLAAGARQAIARILGPDAGVYRDVAGACLARKNYFLGRWIKHGGFWPDCKLRLFRRGGGRFEPRKVHETVTVAGRIETDLGKRFAADGIALEHHSYPTLAGYIEHMNRYSSLGAEMAGPRGFSFLNIVARPLATFIYNYFFRLGFLDGREGLLLHLYHAVYVSWKYAKAWELRRMQQ
jgi:glycosyltransferase involved in cell wall biosynthesis